MIFLDNFKSASIVLLVCVCAYQHMKLDDYQNELIKAQEQARTQTIELNNQIEQINKDREDEQKQANATISDLRKRVRNGVHINASKTVSSSATSPAGEGGCKLSGADAEFLVTVAERADNNARKLNQCIDSYNLLRKK